MKLRKLKKIKQEQQGWPTTIKVPSSYRYSDIYYSYEHTFKKRVHRRSYTTSWPRQAWRRFNE